MTRKRGSGFKSLMRRLRAGEIVRLADGSWRWLIRLLGWNILCKVCKIGKHKDLFTKDIFNKTCDDCYVPSKLKRVNTISEIKRQVNKYLSVTPKIMKKKEQESIKDLMKKDNLL